MYTSSFLGRNDELAALANAVTASRLVTVIGPGGVGKTRLTTEALPALQEGFDGAARVVSLAAIDHPGDVGAISALFGASSPEAVALSLPDGTTLVLLDNCEHVVSAAAGFVTRLLRASDGVSVLATSREPLGVRGERLLALKPFEIPGPADDPSTSPAVRLFFDRALEGGTDVPAEPAVVADVVELCRRIDGLPLAIELAAGRARTLSPGELLTLTDQRLRLLTGSRRDDPRHASVRATIEVSVERLDPSARQFFARLAVFTGPFDLDLAHAVAGDPRADRVATADHLSELTDRSLITADVSAGSTTFRLLELVREYARSEVLSPGERTDTLERLTQAMLVEAGEIVASGPRLWSEAILHRVAARFNHLTNAIAWCVEHDETPGRAFGLLVSLFAAVHQHLSSDVRAAADRVFGRWPHERAPLRGEAGALWATALAVEQDADAAERVVAELFDDPDATPLALAAAARAGVLAALSRSDPVAAHAWVEVGRTMAATSRVVALERELTTFEASILDRLGDHPGALALVRSAVDASADAHDPVNECWARLVLANIEARTGRWDEVVAQTAAVRRLGIFASGGPAASDVYRSRALLAAHEAAARSFLHGWAGATDTWLAAIESAARRGSLAELVITLRAAAGTARELGFTEVAQRLAEAIPGAGELVLVPDLFPSDDVPAHRVAVPTASAAALRTARDALAASGDPVAGASVVTANGASLVYSGDMWSLTFRGSSVWIRDLKGVHDLAVLLARPGEQIHCSEFAGPAAAPDDHAIQAWRSELNDLTAAVDEARAANDPARAERAEAELEALVARLSATFGVDPALEPSTSERSRNAVTFRIRTAQRRIAEVHPELGRHLRNSIRTGAWCVYEPEVAVEWDVRAA